MALHPVDTAGMAVEGLCWMGRAVGEVVGEVVGFLKDTVSREKIHE
jgi:hypothetical protein